MNFFHVIRSKRKTLSIEVAADGSLQVRAPFWMSDAAIRRALSEKEKWIEDTRKKLALLPQPIVIDRKEAAVLRRKAELLLAEKVRFWSEKVGLEYQSIKITSAQKRFGSCNLQGGLCFSLFLATYSDDLIDYVVVHELCHTKEHNHSKRFYQLLSSILPDWKERQDRLRSIPMPRIK